MSIRFVVALLGLSCGPLAAAQIATYGDLKAQNAQQVSGAELQAMLPGAHVVNRTSGGSVRNWTNNPDGTFIASSDGRGTSGSGRYTPSTGRGTWRIDDQGRLCVTIQWPRNPDDWCRMIYKAGGKYYGVGRTDDSATTMEFEFTR